MIDVISALLPVFLTILTGYGLMRAKLIGEMVWGALEHICYYLLFPVLIVTTLVRTDLDSVPFLALGGALLGGALTMSALMLALRPVLMSRLGLSGPSYSTLFQTTTRWHTFAALAVITSLYGNEGLLLASIGVAVLIPVLNVINVIVVAHYADGERPGPQRLARLVAINPFIWACLIGVVYNLSGLPLPDPVFNTLDLISDGALGLGLLTVGAALRINAALDRKAPIITASILKLLVMPVFMALWATVIGLDGLAFTIAVLCGAVSTASTSYVLARQLGGDSRLAANIITFQVLASAFTLPVMIWLAQELGG